MLFAQEVMNFTFPVVATAFYLDYKDAAVNSVAEQEMRRAPPTESQGEKAADGSLTDR